MDENEYAETVARLTKVNTVVAKLDPAIRASAFEILQPYVEGSASERPAKQKRPDPDATSDELEAFFDKHESEKDSDNAHAIAAWWYSQYGKEPISFDDLRRIAKEADVDIPDRLDAVAVAKRESKPLYRKAGSARFKPTSHGEAYFKTTYDVDRGRKAAPASNGE